ncbi:LytR/AlgR family response regulator transcription factor [Pseudoblastomonas halimionae]|uniref:Response regulator n=1 Tax=Alteriqipengyuania halimionae TaxID=1926630 RepID=A0A6I4U6G0_9SPHN|nr:LytTR family DNA-binding domain-containing protein [Alteriqipengyuania halimionae]MXP10042.1 response regulator [Alteriqipengyuania halimionae]
MKVCLADDEALARERMRCMLALEDDVTIASESPDGEDALAMIERHQPDIVLLDIEMPKADGFDVVDALGAIRFTAAPPLIIFATAFPRLAAQAFDTGAVDFLTKPVRHERLQLALSRARETLTTRDAVDRLDKLRMHLEGLRADREEIEDTDVESRSIWVSQGAEAIRVDLAKVDHVAAEAEYIRLHCGEQSFLHRQSMRSFVDEAEALGFVRVHRSYAVSRKHCQQTQRTSWGGQQVVLTSGAVVPVGKKYRDRLADIVS